MTLFRWKRHPDFQARVDEHIEAFRRTVRRKGIAIVENRVAALQERWLKMQQVISERAAAPQMQEVPGGTTGLLVHQVKGIGRGDDFRIVDEYKVDDGLLAELRAHEKQAAQELAQWLERQDVTSGGEMIGYLIQPPAESDDDGRTGAAEPEPEA